MSGLFQLEVTSLSCKQELVGKLVIPRLTGLATRVQAGVNSVYWQDILNFVLCACHLRLRHNGDQVVLGKQLRIG